MRRFWGQLFPGDILRRFANEYALLIAVSLIWFLIQFIRMAFPPLFGTFQQQFDITNAGTGLLFTVLMGGYSIVQFPSGALSDRIGRPQTIIFGVLVFSLGAIALLFANSFVVLLALAIIIGIGSGVHKNVAINLLATKYPQRTARALGSMDTIGQSGGAVAPIVVVLFQSWNLPWPAVFVLSGTLGFVLLVGFYLVVTDGPTITERKIVDKTTRKGKAGGAKESRNTSKQASARDYATTLVNPPLATFTAVVILLDFTWMGISSFLPLYLNATKGLSGTMASLLYSAFFAASLVQIVTGELADRVGELAIVTATLSVSVLAFGLVVFVQTRWLLVAAVVVLGLGLHGFRPVRDAYLMKLIPQSQGGGTLGIIRTLMTAVGSVAPVTVGVVSDQFDLGLAFSAVLVMMVVSVGLVWLIVLRVEGPPLRIPRNL